MPENAKEGSDGEYILEDEHSIDAVDQLQPEDSLIDRGVDDILDEGYSPPETPIGLEAFGTTEAEQREGESLDRKLSKEVPDIALASDAHVRGRDRRFAPIGEEVGSERAGRLLEDDEGIYEDTVAELTADDVGIDGGAASAEEAAVHVIEEP